MATEEKFYGKIYITTYPSPITVEVIARHSAEAKSKIEAQYAGTLKRWYITPRTQL